MKKNKNPLNFKKPGLLAKLLAKRPHLSMTFKLTTNKKARIALIVAPICLGVSGAAIGLGIYNNRKKDPDKTVVVTPDYVNRRIYLVATDNITVPLTVGMPAKKTIQESLLDVFNLLKVGSKIETKSLKGIIPTATVVKNIEVFEDELILNLSENFLTYDVSEDKRILETLAYTFQEFPEVGKINLMVEGKHLDTLPKQKTSVPYFITKNIGINIDEMSSTTIQNGKMVNLFYSKNYDQKEYLIPVSTFIDTDDDLETVFVKAMNQGKPLGKGLKNIEAYQSVSQVQDDKDKDKFILNVNSKGLKEEGLVKRELYDLVNLTLHDLNSTLPVSFTIENEVLAVEGLKPDETYKVSDIIYNEVKI